jgi:hypothetical protein
MSCHDHPLTPSTLDSGCGQVDNNPPKFQEHHLTESCVLSICCISGSNWKTQSSCLRTDLVMLHIVALLDSDIDPVQRQDLVWPWLSASPCLHVHPSYNPSRTPPHNKQKKGRCMCTAQIYKIADRSWHLHPMCRLPLHFLADNEWMLQVSWTEGCIS